MNATEWRAVLEDYGFSGTVSRTQLRQALQYHEDVQAPDAAKADTMIREAVDAGLLEVAQDLEDMAAQDGMIAPSKPAAFKVTR